LNADGTLDTTFVDPGLEPYANNDVHALALQSDGKVLIGGSFTSHVARLNSNGSRDWTFGDTKANGDVNALAIQSDGKVLIGGDFTSVDGATRKRVARLNSNGTLDTTFGDPAVGPDTSPVAEVHALAVQSDGKVLIGGRFSSVGGATRNRVARLNSNGTLDATFVDPNVQSARPMDYVSALALQSDGKVLVVGNIDSVGGVSRTGIARLNLDGTLDTTFVPNVFLPSANDAVWGLAIQLDCTVVIGGSFHTVDGQPRAHVARLFTCAPTAANISGQVRYDADNDGDLTDVESGISGVTIKLYADDGTGKPTGAALATTTTDGSGNYVFTNRAPGNYVVVETNLSGYTSTNDKDGSTNNTLDQIAVVLSGVNSTGNDFLDAIVTILTGVVTDRNTGQIIAGATVTVTDSAGHVYTTTTDANGVYTFTSTVANPLAAGDATVAANSVVGYGSDSQVKTIVAGTTNTQNLSLPPTILTGVVTDRNTGQIIAGATVTVTDSAGHVYTTTTNASGVYTFTSTVANPLAAGAATVAASAPGYGTATATPTLVAGATNTQNLALSPTDSDGDGVPDSVEGSGDRDGDGIPDYLDYDPTGYFYDETTGQIIPGGQIAVTGPGVVTIIHDGSSGYYQFATDGTAGTYTIRVTLPPGYVWSSTCLRQDPPPFDPTGGANPTVLGNGEYGATGFLTSNACTRFYLSFDLATGDPVIFNNNFPLSPPIPVGGIVVPVSKLGLVAPWLGLVALASLAALGVVLVRRRKP
jgi:uncharacterized delta-60 repeat protein